MSDKINQKIVIVDDNEENSLILGELCKSIGYSTEIYDNGARALESINSNLPIAVLLDIKMKEMDGFQVLEKVKSSPKFKEIPVIMVTALDDSGSILKCLNLGADDYIPKPYEPTIVKARLERSIANINSIKKERIVLEKTLSGSMKILSDIISSLSPQLFGKSAKVRRIARLLAEELQYPEIWEIEVASIFSLVGCITFSPELIDKIVNNKTLTNEEKNFWENHPILGYKLLKNIPRLETVAYIVLFQNKSGLENLAESLSNKLNEVPLGSKILKAAFEYELASSKSNSMNELKNILKMREANIDEKVYKALEAVLFKESNREIKSILVNQLSVGMTFTDDVMTTSGLKIISKLQEATESIVERIKAVHFKIPISEPLKVYTTKL